VYKTFVWRLCKIAVLLMALLVALYVVSFGRACCVATRDIHMSKAVAYRYLYLVQLPSGPLALMVDKYAYLWCGDDNVVNTMRLLIEFDRIDGIISDDYNDGVVDSRRPERDSFELK
jgi:hypothetical protein